jgi:signal-transduction protein with cAMP-binding, CBS, and nucleotidyltransferase domain
MKTIETSFRDRVVILLRNEYFDHLPDHLLKEIAENISLRECLRGDVLVWEGDPCEGLHIVEQGSARIFR